MEQQRDEIKRLKAEKKALILAHYYQRREIREYADKVCDSIEMAKYAQGAKEELIVICGVRFMAESAKILSPGKRVLIPREDAGCPMADMISGEEVRRLRRENKGAAVVCYVNSSAEVKAESDVCCTSASALSCVAGMKEERIIFIPDRNLGAYIGSRLPEKEIILYEGYCPVHDEVRREEAERMKKEHPGALLLAHPECRPEVLAKADYIGSTSAIIRYVGESDVREYIIGTEEEIGKELAEQYPEREFHMIRAGFICEEMKKIRREDLLLSLREERYEIELREGEIGAARESLERMVNGYGH